MTDKEFKKLNRAELVEIIYRIQQNEEQLRDENNNLRRQLASKNIKLNNAGSIAEAALALNGVFESAQKAADDYLELIHLSGDEVAEKNSAIINEANMRAAEIIRSAEKKAAQIISTAEAESKKKWDDVNRNIDTLLETHSTLLELLHKEKEKTENNVQEAMPQDDAASTMSNGNTVPGENNAPEQVLTANIEVTDAAASGIPSAAELPDTNV